ncbi:flagellar biosynthesis protein FlhF [Xanthomonas graminis]|nr:hypothetical protein [Xanthomonas translucens]UKE78452.1 hypothetical protein KM317_04245 [Xanthomonas translucens pv. arrhenatheri]
MRTSPVTQQLRLFDPPIARSHHDVGSIELPVCAAETKVEPVFSCNMIANVTKMKTILGCSQTGAIQHAPEVAQEHSPAGPSVPHSDTQLQESLPPAPARRRRTAQPVAGASTPGRGSGASLFSPGPSSQLRAPFRLPQTPYRPPAASALRPLSTLVSEGQLTPEAVRCLKTALPQGGSAISRLDKRDGRSNPKSAADYLRRLVHGTPNHLEKERFAAFMVMVHTDVQAVAARASISIQDAAELMRQGVVNGTLGSNLSDKGKGQMLFALYGVREKYAAQDAVSQAFSAHPAFHSLPVAESWRMGLETGVWGDEKHKGLRFENEPGYMGGMLRGLTAMIQADHGGRKLDAQLLKELHDHATAGVFTRSTLTDGLRLLTPHEFNEISTLTSRCATEQCVADLPPGPVRLLEPDYRNMLPIQFGLIPGGNLSRNGLHEMLGSHNNGEFHIFIPIPGTDERLPATAATDWSRQEAITVFAPAGTRRQLMARAQNIIDRNASLIRAAPMGDSKLSAIARCCQDLERAHLFDDGNARTIGLLVVNKLLLENGLRPAMMEDPNRFDGFSTDELVAEIKRGQATFARYSTQ